MKIKERLSFKTLGQLPMEDAVVGIITNDGIQRIAIAVMTEGLTSHKRKEKLALARQELNENVISLDGNKKLTDHFTGASVRQIKATIKHAEDAGPGISFMLQETQQPIIIFDCQEKSSFWSVLKSLGVDSNTLFSLAELEALKPIHTSNKQVKSVGTAHELCAALSKSITKAANDDNALTRRTIKSIRHAKKYKIPSFNIYEQERIARSQHANRPSLTTSIRYPLMRMMGRAAITIGKISRLFGNTSLPTTKREFILAAHKGALKFHQKYNRNVSIEHYERMRKVTEALSDEEVETIFNTSAHQILSADSIEELNKKHSVYHMHSGDYFDINVREGYHFLQHPECLFEFDLEDKFTRDENSEDKVYALARQDGNEITASFFTRQNGNFSKFTTSAVIRLDEHMQMVDWSEIDNATNEVISTKSRSFLETFGEQRAHIVPGFMGHIASICSRMNEPDYTAHIVTPTGGKARSSKHAFPYFEYEVVQDPLRPTHIRTVSSRIGEQTRSSPVFHKVARHTRTLYRGTPDEHVIIIPPHTRGDASKGVKATGIEAQLN